MNNAETYDPDATAVAAEAWASERTRQARDHLAATAWPVCLMAARSFRKKRSMPMDVLPDLQMDAAVGLLRAIDTWDPALGPFGPHAWRRCQGAILDALRDDDHLSRDHRRKLNAAGAAGTWTEKAVSYDAHLADQPGWLDTMGVDGDFADRVALVVDVAGEIAALPQKHRDALVRKMTGGSASEMAARLGVTESRLSQIVSEAKACLPSLTHVTAA